MAESIREILLKLGYDDTAVQQGVPRTNTALKSIDNEAKGTASGLAILGTAAAAATATFATLIAAAQRGQNFNELKNAFDSTGASIDALREKSQGLVSDFQLMKSSNLADSLGVTKEQFELLTEAADTLGDKVGVDTADALELLTRGLGQAQERALKQLGVTIDATAANEKFARSLGISAKELNEAGKQSAFRAEAELKIREALAATNGEVASAGEGYQKLTVAISNAIDQASAAVDKNEALAKTFEGLAKNIAAIDWGGFISGVENAAVAIVEFIPPLEAAARGLAALLSYASKDFSLAGQIADTRAEIVKLEREIAEAQERGGLGSSVTIIDKTAQLTDARKRLTDQTFKLSEEQVKFNNTTSDAIKIGQLEGALFDGLKPKVEDAKSKYTDLAKGQEKAAEAAQKHADALKQLDQELSQAKFDNVITNLNKQFEQQLSSGSVGGLGGIIEQIKEQTRQKVLEGYGDALRDSPQARELAEIAAEQVGTQLEESVTDHMKDAFQNSVDFFTDAFYNAMTGAAFDFEDIFKRVLAGFAGQAAASLLGGTLQSLGLNLGNVSSAQGLGQSIFSSIFGGGATGAAGAAGGGAAAGGFSLAGLGNLLPFAAAALTANAAFTGGQRLANGGRLNTQERALLALPTFGFSELANFGSGFFGGGASQDELNRRGFRGFLQENSPLGERLQFGGVRGPISLFDSEFNFSNGRTQFTDQALGLVSPLASIFGKGDKKLTSDIAGIFADAIDDGKNFTEVLIQAQSLMQGLGKDAGQIKTELSNAFLDSVGGVEEYIAALSQINFLTAERLPNGLADVAEALSIIGDETTTNRAQLNALALTFQALQEAGIDTASEISAYFSDRFGPDVADALAQIAATGVDTFEEIRNASADQIAAIFSILLNAKDEFASVFSDLGDQAATGFEQGAKRIAKSLGDIKNAARDVQVNISATGGAQWHTLKTGSRGNNAARVDENVRNYRLA